MQSVSGPTQERGHTLDLVLSHRLSVFNLEIWASFSNHTPVLFEVALSCNTVEPCTPARRCHILNPSTAAHFNQSIVTDSDASIVLSYCHKPQIIFTTNSVLHAPQTFWTEALLLSVENFWNFFTGLLPLRLQSYLLHMTPQSLSHALVFLTCSSL